MFGLPLVFLPCREALLLLPSLVYKYRYGTGEEEEKEEERKRKYTYTPTSTHRPARRNIFDGVDFDEERPLLAHRPNSTPRMMTITTATMMIPPRAAAAATAATSSLRHNPFSKADYGSYGNIVVLPPPAQVGVR